MSTTTSMLSRRPPRHLMRRGVACFLVWCCVVPMVIGTPGAGADDVGDLQARADKIARQLMTLQQQLGVLGEQFNQSQVRRARLAEKKAAIERRSKAAKVTLEARRADAARYALSAYAGLGQGDTLSMALDGRQWELSRRDGYAAIRIGDREQVVDDLQAAQQIDEDLVASLNDATEAESQVLADLEEQQQRASKLMANQKQLQASVQGELAEAVAQRQAALLEEQRQERSAQARADGSSPSSTGRPSSTRDPVSAPTGAPGQPGSTAPGTTTGGPTATPTTPSGPSPTQPPATSPPVTSPPPPPPPVSPPPAGSRGQRAANAAISQLGVRYSWGGGTPSGPSYGFGPGAGIKGFDCSGLTLYAWAQSGVMLYHSAQMQYNQTTHLSLSQLQPGDLVFYGSSAGAISHVSIYVGGGQVVHAPNSSTVVQYGQVQLWSGYYPWIGAGRPG